MEKGIKVIAGTVEGGRKAAISNKRRYGEDFYRTIGRLGGRKSTGAAFRNDPDLAREAGRKGGQISRRGKATGLEHDPTPPWHDPDV